MDNVHTYTYNIHTIQRHHYSTKQWIMYMHIHTIHIHPIQYRDIITKCFSVFCLSLLSFYLFLWADHTPFCLPLLFLCLFLFPIFLGANFPVYLDCPNIQNLFSFLFLYPFLFMLSSPFFLHYFFFFTNPFCFLSPS